MWLNGVEMGEQQQQHQWHKDIKLKCEERNFIPYRHNLNQFLFLMCLFMCFAWGTRCGLQMNSFGSLLTLFVSQRVRRKCVSVRRICAADFRFDRRSFSLLLFLKFYDTYRVVLLLRMRQRDPYRNWYVGQLWKISEYPKHPF